MGADQGIHLIDLLDQPCPGTAGSFGQLRFWSIENYGSDNKERLTGEHETASWNTFTAGVANRGASIRVPTQTYYDKSGYIEDRRPSSNMDPYVVTSLLANTIILKGKEINLTEQVSMIGTHTDGSTVSADVSV